MRARASTAQSPKQEVLLLTLRTAILFLFPILFLTSLALAELFSLFGDPGFSSPWVYAVRISLPCTIGAAVPTYFAYRNLLNPFYEGSSGVDRSRYLTLQMSYPVAFQRCLDSLSLFGNQRVLLEDQEHGRIEAALLVEPIWKALFSPSGLRVSFRLGSDQEDATKVLVTSKSPLPTAMVGSRQNEKNVERISVFLEKAEVDKQNGAP